MIIRNEEHKRKTVENLLGGSGKAHFKNIIETPEELYGKGRVFSFITLDPGAECGWHIHNGDGEYYCILEGEGEYSDNGTPVMLHAGDTAFCPDGALSGAVIIMPAARAMRGSAQAPCRCKAA